MWRGSSSGGPVMEAWSGMDNSDEAVQMVPAKKSNRVESFKYDTLPADFRDALAVFDEDGSGDLNAAEIRKAAKTYKDFSNNNGVYALDSFPNDLQNELKVFDVDGDGTVSADELGRACVLYRDSRRKFKKAVRGAMVLAFIVLFLLAANCGLVFAVVYLTKDTATSSDGAMTVKNSNTPVSVGSMSQMVSVIANTEAFGKLSNDTFNAFRTKPESMGVTLKDGSVFNFPVEWFEASNTQVKVGNSAMGYAVTITKDTIPEVVYPENSPFAMGDSPVLKIRVFARPGVSQMSEEDDSEVDETTLVKPKANGAATAELIQANIGAMAGMIPFQDISQDAQHVPQQNATGGLATEWIFKLKAGNSSVTEDNLELCCDTIMSYNGTCAEGAPFDMAILNSLLEVSITRSDLAQLRQDPSFGKDTNDCGIFLIAKVKRIGTPSFKRMHPHQADAYQLHRHTEVRRMVLSTVRGSRIHRHIQNRASKEGWFDPLRDQKRRRRSLQQVTASATSSIVGAVITAESANIDCFVGGAPYVGDADVVQGLNAKCVAWTSADAPDSEAVGKFCRKGYGYDFPLCPYIDSASNAKSYAKCDVPHCVEGIFSNWEAAPMGLTAWDWGLERIASRDVTYDVALDRTAVTGNGVHCFIIDSGVSNYHEEFTGRVVSEFDAFTGASTQEDDFGHGTHVAGTMAGKNHGVAPGCSLHFIKSLTAQGGSGTPNPVYAGIDYAANTFKEIKNQNPDAKGVVNLSLGGEFGSYWEEWAKILTDVGLAVVAAAGNEDQDACTKSPAHVPEVLTVGATYLDDSKTVFSNWGSCVQIFAPGAGIKSAKAFTTNEYTWMGGTSMAAPFVAGALALYFEVHPTATPADAITWAREMATTGKVNGLSDTTFIKHGLSAADWQTFASGMTSGTLAPADDVDNMNATPENRLLYIPYWAAAAAAPPADPTPAATTQPPAISATPPPTTQPPAATTQPPATAITQPPASPPPAEGTDIPLCSEIGEDGYFPWTSDGECPEAGSSAPICGSKTFAGNPDLWMPVFKEVRECDFSKCICAQDFEERYVSCNPDKSDVYTYLENCGTPAAMIETTADTQFLQGKIVTFTPVAGSDMTSFTTCKKSLSTSAGGAPVLPYPHTTDSGALSLKNYMSAYSYITLSLPITFRFHDSNSGKVKSYSKINIHPNGHVNFASKAYYTMDYSLSGHFNMNKGAGISGLYGGIAIDGCGTASGDCGDVLVWAGYVTNSRGVQMVKTVITYLNVPTMDAGVDDASARSSVQIVLHNDDSGSFELVYGSVSSLLQGGATYGVSLGQGEVPEGLTNPRFSPTCTA